MIDVFIEPVESQSSRTRGKEPVSSISKKASRKCKTPRSHLGTRGLPSVHAIENAERRTISTGNIWRHNRKREVFGAIVHHSRSLEIRDLSSSLTRGVRERRLTEKRVSSIESPKKRDTVSMRMKREKNDSEVNRRQVRMESLASAMSTNG